MKQLVIVASMVEKLIVDNKYSYIGVDKGAFFLANKHLVMDYAIGDFDSVTEHEYKLIKDYANEVIVLSKIKDETDLEAAINLALALGYKEVTIYGALGGRVDHLYANLVLMVRYKDQIIITLVDENNYLTILNKNKSYQLFNDGYKYYSFFTPTTAKINLIDFKYSVQNLVITNMDIKCISNEIIDQEATIELISGEVILIKSND